MVIKWSADVDQILLLKILEVHNISVNTKDIADKWPTDREKPTPRAISERLVKLRSIVKSANNSNAGHFTISKNPSNPSTPTKPRAPKTPTSSVTKNRQTVTGSAAARPKSTIKTEDNVLESTEIIDVDDEGGINIKPEPTLETVTNNAGPGPGPGLLTPSEPSSGAQSMDGASDMPGTPTPARHMVTRGRRVRTYATEEPESSDDSDVSDFRAGGMSPASTVQGDEDEEMDGIWSSDGHACKALVLRRNDG